MNSKRRFSKKNDKSSPIKNTVKKIKSKDKRVTFNTVIKVKYFND